MWSWCGVDVELMLSCFLYHVHFKLCWCGADEELMWIWCGADVELMKSWCWADEELILSWCGADVKQMWSWCGALNRENGDLRTEMGTQKLKKVPMGAGSLKWGLTWEQCWTKKKRPNRMWNRDHAPEQKTTNSRQVKYFCTEKGIFCKPFVGREPHEVPSNGQCSLSVLRSLIF